MKPEDATDAGLPPVEPPVMPAAWMLRALHDGSQKPWPTLPDSDAHRLAAKRSDFECSPLYSQAALDAAVAAERERCERNPLTHMQVVMLWGHRSDGPSTAEVVSFARAIEREHGIGPNRRVQRQPDVRNEQPQDGRRPSA